VDVVPKFSNPDAEYCFRKYHCLEAKDVLHSSCNGQIFFNIFLIYAEVTWNLSGCCRTNVIICRGLIVVFLSLWKMLLKFDRVYYCEYSCPVMYTFYGIILLVMHSIVSYVQDQEAMEDVNYLFYAGRWSLSDAIIYIAFCFNATLRFSQAFAISSAFITTFTVLPFFLYYPEYDDLLLDYSVFLLPALFVLCMLSAQDLEMNFRLRFLRLNQLGHDLRRRDTLIHSILPENISEALKKGEKEKLATHHENVTVLFCSIVDFNKHSSSCHAEDIVKLLIRIVTLFDQIVEHMGVYKVENIADTYMCCDGLNRSLLGNTEEMLGSGDHSSKIARTAIAMREATEYFQWRWADGSPVVVKLGIHTGPVTAGVIGTKSYSYHLFGDTVNTASRMCTYSLPGQITVSKNTVTHIRKADKSLFTFHKRGKVDVKGKGPMDLYWLDGFQSDLNRESLADVYAIDARVDLSQNIGRFLDHPESENDVPIGIRRLNLGFFNAQADAAIYRDFTVLDRLYYKCTTAGLRYSLGRLYARVKRMFDKTPHYSETESRASTPPFPAKSPNRSPSRTPRITPTSPLSLCSPSQTDVESGYPNKRRTTESTQRLSNSTWATLSSRHSSQALAREALTCNSDDDVSHNENDAISQFKTPTQEYFKRASWVSEENKVDYGESDSKKPHYFKMTSKTDVVLHLSSESGLERVDSNDVRAMRSEDFHVVESDLGLISHENTSDANWLTEDMPQSRPLPPRPSTSSVSPRIHPVEAMEGIPSSHTAMELRPKSASDATYPAQSTTNLMPTKPMEIESSSSKAYHRSLSDSNQAGGSDSTSSPQKGYVRARSCDLSPAENRSYTSQLYGRHSPAGLDRDGDKIDVIRERKQSGVNMSGVLRRGSSILSSAFLHSNSNSRGGGSWMSTSSDHSGSKQKSASDIYSQRIDEEENSRLDALVEHSSCHHTIASYQAMHSKAQDLENNFRERSNKQNMDQIRRVLMLVLLYQLFYILIGDFISADIYGAVVVFSALIFTTIFEQAYANIQLVGIGLVAIVFTLHAQNVRNRDQRSIPVHGICLIVFAVVNVHLRLRFAYCALLSSVILCFILLHLTLTSEPIESWQIGVSAYIVFMTISTLQQCYVKEKSLRITFRRLQSLQEDSDQSTQLLENMLPRPVHAKQLLQGELVFDELHNVTLLYSDIKGFTPLSARLKPQVLCKLLNLIYSAFDRHLEHFGLYKVDTIGDAFIVVGGLPGYNSQHNHALSCLQFALHMQNDMKIIRSACDVDVELRIGIHTGSVIGSVISLNKPRYLLWGSATQVAGAMESCGTPGTIHLSSETAKILEDDDLSCYNITLAKQDFNPDVALHTDASYVATCSDLRPFFHDTWSSGYSPTRNISSEQEDSTILGVMGNIAKQLHNNLRGVNSGATTMDSESFDDITSSSLDGNVVVKSPKRKSGSFFNSAAIDELKEFADSDDENASESNTNDRRSRKLRLVSRKSSIVDVAATMWRRVACKYISGAVWC